MFFFGKFVFLHFAFAFTFLHFFLHFVIFFAQKATDFGGKIFRPGFYHTTFLVGVSLQSPLLDQGGSPTPLLPLYRTLPGTPQVRKILFVWFF